MARAHFSVFKNGECVRPVGGNLSDIKLLYLECLYGETEDLSLSDIYGKNRPGKFNRSSISYKDLINFKTHLVRVSSEFPHYGDYLKMLINLKNDT